MNDKNQLVLFEGPQSSPPTPDDEVSLVALSLVPGIGFATVQALFNTFDGHLARTWGASSDSLYRALQRLQAPQLPKVVELIQTKSDVYISHAKEQLQFLKARRNVSILLRGTEGYPPRLNDLKDPPAWLFVQGEVKILQQPGLVAVVGTRNPTETGLLAAKHLSLSLVRWGYTILSGLAEGIDAVGHQTANDYSIPTVAVLGHGIEVVYPASTGGIREQIVQHGGAIVSEYLPGDLYSREKFIRRNRIQAALSDAIGVVEGTSKSGTAHTVQYARSLKRPLFGVSMGSLAIETEQHDLLVELQHHGFPVYDLEAPDGLNDLRAYLQTYSSVADEGQGEQVQLFQRVVEEIKRLAGEYSATSKDYSWLISEIEKMSQGAKR